MTASDETFIRRALDLARQGIGLTSPNPCVGAAIVDASGTIVGSGFHTYDGLKHAEVLSIEQAGTKARGASLYVNLEPCSHQGRTGPCADAIIAAGIRRVVASMQDPNPLVSGQGFARLRSAGIEVETGLLAEEAKALNESFAKYIRHRTPLVTLKSAMTLDGKIALPPGMATARGADRTNETWITGEPARAHVQQLRHQHDAILTGVGTVIADDPLLTDRSGLPRRRPLLRVILDSHLRLPMESRMVQSSKNDVMIFSSVVDAKRKQQLEERGVRVQQIPASTADGRPDLVAVARCLGEMAIPSLLIEGGSTINGAALASGVVDKIFLYYAPKILGTEGSVPFAKSFTGAVHVKSIKLHRFGDDFAVEGYLRDPYTD